VANYREGLYLIPEHMRHAVQEWAEKGTPNPDDMGGFLFAVLSNDLSGAFSAADETNAEAMRRWAEFLHWHMDPRTWGSEEKLFAWHARHVAERKL